MDNHPLGSIVTKGGMTSLKELPKQEKTPIKDKYFDEFNTYAPFKWLGSRRLTKEELREQVNLDVPVQSAEPVV